MRRNSSKPRLRRSASRPARRWIGTSALVLGRHRKTGPFRAAPMQQPVQRNGRDEVKAARYFDHRRCARGEPFHHGCGRRSELRRGSAERAWPRRTLGARRVPVTTRRQRHSAQLSHLKRLLSVSASCRRGRPGRSRCPPNCARRAPALASPVSGSQSPFSRTKDEGRRARMPIAAPGHALRRPLGHWSQWAIDSIACAGSPPRLRNTHEPSRRSGGPSSCQQSSRRRVVRPVCSSRVAFSVLSWPRPGQK